MQRAAADVIFEGVAQQDGAKNQYDGGEISWRGPCLERLANGRLCLRTPTGGGIRNVDGSGGLYAYLAYPAADNIPSDRQAGEDLTAALHAAVLRLEPLARQHGFLIGAGQALIVVSLASLRTSVLVYVSLLYLRSDGAWSNARVGQLPHVSRA